MAPAAKVTGGSGALEIVRRRGADASYLFIVNHGDAAASAEASGFELITEVPVAGNVDVPGGAVRIIREEAAA